MRTRCIVRIALCMASTQAYAQAPTNVNDCTLLPDPVALKRCVDGFGPQALRPLSPVPAPASPSEAAQAEPAAKAPLIPPAPTRSDDWLHGNRATAKPTTSDPRAIRLDE